MVNMNGAALQSMTHNGVEVQTWTHNGVEVYSAFTPFYVVENGFLVDGNYTSASRINIGLHSGYNLDYGYYGVDATSNANAGAIVSFDTRGAKTIRIKGENYFSSQIYTLTIKVTSENGVIYTQDNNANFEIEVDVSNHKTITVEYRGVGSNGQLGCRITEIYCGK